jgi:hypothetical protein
MIQPSEMLAGLLKSIRHAVTPFCGPLTAILATAIAVSSVACGQSSGEEEAQGEGFTLPPALVDSLLAASSEEQKEALGDLRISFEEYEQAVFRTIECLSDVGLTPTRPELKVQGLIYRFTFSVPDEDEELFAGGESCLRDHLRSTEAAWAWVHRPTEQELLVAEQDFVRCLREHGLDAPNDPDPSYFLSIRREPAFESCRQLVEEQHAIPGFSP